MTAEADLEYHNPPIFSAAAECDGAPGMNWHAWKLLALLLAMALAVRLAACLHWQSRLDQRRALFGFPDSESYWVLGRAIAEGRPYQYGPEEAQIFRTPGYPLLLAPLFWTGGGQPRVIWARVQSAAFGTLAVAGVCWLGWRLFDARTGLIAAAMATFYPGAVAISAFVLSEAPFCPMMLLHLALWTAAWRAASPRRAALLAVFAGLAAGGATLIRPSWLLFAPFALVVGLVSGDRKGRADAGLPLPQALPKGRGRHAWIGALMLAGLIIAMAPWWIRNARLSGRFVPTTSQVGASLYDGLNPGATGGSNMELVPEAVEELRGWAAAGELERDVALELEIDRGFRAAASTFARDNPAKVARLAGRKLVRMWNLWPNEPSFSAWPLRLVVLLTYLPILALGIMGAVRTIHRGWPYIMCWLPAVYFTVLHVVFVGSIRYRQPAMLGVIVLAAGAVGSSKRWRKKG